MLKPTAIPASILSQRRVFFLDGILYFNADYIAEVDPDMPDIRDVNATTMSVETMRTLNTPKPRGRYNTAEVIGDMIYLRRGEKEIELQLSDKISCFSPFEDVFWTTDPYPPYPTSARFQMYTRHRPTSVKLFQRQFDRGEMNYTVLDGKIISWIRNVPNQPVAIGYFNNDEVLLEATGTDGVSRFQPDKRLFAAGRRVYFTDRDEAEQACDHSW